MKNNHLHSQLFMKVAVESDPQLLI